MQYFLQPNSVYSELGVFIINTQTHFFVIFLQYPVVPLVSSHFSKIHLNYYEYIFYWFY